MKADSKLERIACLRLSALARGAALALSAAWALAACNRGAPSPSHDPPPPDSAPPAPAAPTQASATTEASASATAPEATASALAGTWEGSYDAKKGAVGMPKNVKDVARSKDDGKTAAGRGTITITIAPAGTVSGSGKGALGDVELSGKVDESAVRATIIPQDPTAPNAMTGVLVAMAKEGVLRGEIRVAGPDATVVRESAIELKKK